MSLASWIVAIRRKPIEERKRIVGTWTIIVMVIVTLVWFPFFFTGLSKRLADTKNVPPLSETASVANLWDKPTAPFPKK